MYKGRAGRLKIGRGLVVRKKRKEKDELGSEVVVEKGKGKGKAVDQDSSTGAGETMASGGATSSMASTTPNRPDNSGASSKSPLPGPASSSSAQSDPVSAVPKSTTDGVIKVDESGGVGTSGGDGSGGGSGYGDMGAMGRKGDEGDGDVDMDDMGKSLVLAVQYLRFSLTQGFVHLTFISSTSHFRQTKTSTNLPALSIPARCDKCQLQSSMINLTPEYAHYGIGLAIGVAELKSTNFTCLRTEMTALAILTSRFDQPAVLNKPTASANDMSSL